MLCTYCDFVKYKGFKPRFPQYLAALIQEAQRWPVLVPSASLYLGGGPPSALGPSLLQQLIQTLRTIFRLESTAEISVELNPEDVTTALRDALLDAGVTRVTLGVQTWDDRALRKLGRLHTGNQAYEAIAMLQSTTSLSIGLDLIYGLPNQDLANWQQQLQKALELEIHHLSCYALTLEAGTPLTRHVQRGRLPMPNDDLIADMYDLTTDVLAQHGYCHYEVSNWARPGHQSLHNSLYWNGDEYVGLGVGAVGYASGIRWWNERLVPRYLEQIASGQPTYTTSETIHLLERVEELILLQLRTSNGIDLHQFQQRTSVNLAYHTAEVIGELCSAGFLLQNNTLTVPEQHWKLLNAITSSLIAPIREHFTASQATS
jgi:oxygen-independent coproporphyrinogen-3 oxidase